MTTTQKSSKADRFARKQSALRATHLALNRTPEAVARLAEITARGDALAAQVHADREARGLPAHPESDGDVCDDCGCDDHACQCDGI